MHLAQRVAEIAAVQNAFNKIDRRHEALAKETEKQGIAFIAHTPVGTGKISSQASLLWLLAFGDHIVPIPGTSNLTHLVENMATLQGL